MKLAVFGATGSLGRVIVERALAAGHGVTGLSRSASHPRGPQEGLTMVKGDVLDLGAVRRAVRGQEAVIVALGGGLWGRTRSEGTRAVVKAMEAEGVKRLICLSSLGVGDSEYVLNFYWRRIMFGGLLWAVYRDHHRQEKIVRRSSLNWTLVRPGAFTDGPAQGTFYQGDLRRLKGKLKLAISRADIANFMLGAANDGGFSRGAVALSD